MASTLDDFLPSVITTDTRKRIQAYDDLLPYLSDPTTSLACEEFDKFVEGLTGWINSSNFKISLNGLELISLIIDRIEDDFKPHCSTVLPAAIDRLGDNKDAVRESAQELLQKLMSPVATPQYVFERCVAAFSHKLWHVREEICFALQKALNSYGARAISLSKLVPPICKLVDDQNSQVREAAINTLVEIYRHVGERVRSDVSKKDISQAKLNVLLSRMDDVQASGEMLVDAKDDVDFAKPVGPAKTAKRGSSSSGPSSRKGSASKSSGGTGAMDEEAFIAQFEDVPTVHLYSSRELTEHINRIREILSDPNKDWEKRQERLKELRALLLAGATDYDDFYPGLRSLEPSLQISVKDLRSQIVREAAISIAYYSQQLGNKFDHFAEAVLPNLIVLIMSSAKVMATAGTVCIRFIIQYTHAPRLIPIITSNVTSKSSQIRRECTEFLELLLHTWPTHTIERHIAIVQEAIKRALSDADQEARAHARKAYWGFADHFKDQADALLNSLEPAKQKQLTGHLSHSTSNNSLNSVGRSTASAKVKSGRVRSISTERSQTAYGRTSSGTGSMPRRSTITSTVAGTAKVNSSPRRESTGSIPGNDQLNGGLVRSSSAAELVPNTPKSGLSSRLPQNNYSSLRLIGEIYLQDNKKRVRFNFSASADSVQELGSDEEDLDLHRSRPRSSSGPIKTILRNARSTGKLTRLSLSFDERTTPSSAQRRLPPTPDRSQSRSPVGLPPSGSRIPRFTTPPPAPRAKKTINNTSSMISPDRSRPRSRIGVSQSQPSSRSGSPSSRLAYITHTAAAANAAANATRPRRKSGIPRSQGASRENSPPRMHGRERKLSAGTLRTSYGPTHPTRTSKSGGAQRVLTHPADVEAVASALENLRLPSRKRYESYESDDASETSSVCSERSFSSYGRSSEMEEGIEKDVAEILANLSSASWADRKEGLTALQNMLRSSRVLNRLELKKITEIFTRMFHDPHGKVFSMFLETLSDFVAVHRSDLHDWLYVLLTRLLNKLGADMLGSVHSKVQRALEAVRDSFAYDHQFNTLTRFIIDQTQTPNLKVKVALLNYLHGLVLMMDPSDFVNSSDTRLAVSRIITWTTEPKSVDVRKAAQAVLIALFNLNTPEFSMMLSVLPKTFQEGATKILHNHLRSSSQESDVLSPRNVTSPTSQFRYKPSPQRSRDVDEFETENMNPEDIYNSIRKASADIQNLSKLDQGYEENKKERDSTSQDSGIQSSMHDVRAESPEGRQQDNVDSPRSDRRRHQYNPNTYQDESVNGYNRAALAEAVFDVENELFNEGHPAEEDEVTEILTELSNHNERQEERKNAMLQLIKLARRGIGETWDEHFKTVLLLLLETLGDNDGHIRALSLRVLKEILRHHPERFKDYAELTILKILEAHKDPIKEVTRAAEECAGTLATSIPAEQCIRVLNPIIQTADYPVNLAAIKMQTKVVETMDKESLDKMLPDIISGLLKGYDDGESSVRKASVFCLVALYMVTGEELRPYLHNLNGSKMKLLNLYIKRAQSQVDTESATTSKTTSPITDQV